MFVLFFQAFPYRNSFSAFWSQVNWSESKNLTKRPEWGKVLFTGEVTFATQGSSSIFCSRSSLPVVRMCKTLFVPVRGFS